MQSQAIGNAHEGGRAPGRRHHKQVLARVLEVRDNATRQPTTARTRQIPAPQTECWDSSPTNRSHTRHSGARPERPKCSCRGIAQESLRPWRMRSRCGRVALSVRLNAARPVEVFAACYDVGSTTGFQGLGMRDNDASIIARSRIAGKSL